MKQNLWFYFLLLAIISCKNSAQKPEGISNFKFSKFRWCYDDQKKQHYFCLKYYMTIDQKGRFTIHRRSLPTDSLICYKGQLGAKQYNVVMSTVNSQMHSQDYVSLDSCLVVYSGFTYCLDFDKSGKRILIQYIPPCSPKNILQITEELDTIAEKANEKSGEKSSLLAYETFLRALSSKYIPPLPSEPPNGFETVKRK